MSCTANHLPSWDDIWQDIKMLNERLPKRGPLFLYGIPRGGRVLVALLPYLNDRVRIDDLYRGDSLVVDDVIETGRTVAPLPGARIFALYGKVHRMPSQYTNCVLHECSCNIYIRFPWESEREHYVERTGEER